MKYLLFVLLIIALLLLIALIKTLLIGSKKTFYQYSTDQKRIDLYSEKLSKLIQYETISYRDKPDVEKFRGFHKVIEKLYPNVFKHLEKIEIDGNLMMKWKGTDPNLDPIILISHQDVVEAGGDWIYPPFSGTIADGKVWGRGAGDIKVGIMSFYQAVEELLKEGYTPKCDVYLGSSCTEEIGGDGAPKMANWFKERGIKLYLLSDEGGSIVSNPLVGVDGNFAAIGIFEKGYGDLKIIAKSSGGHSSTPAKNSPIARLAKFITEIETKNPFKVEFSAAVDAMLTNLAPYSTNFMLKFVMSNLWLFKPLLKIVMPAISPHAAAMLQTTICFTMQKGSDGYNVIPQEAYVTANLRYIPHQSTDEANNIVKEIAKKYDLEVETIVAGYPSKPIDLEGEQYNMIVDTINKVFPGVGIMPYVVCGGTDSRFFAEVCDNCVRFAPVNYTPEQLKGMHGLNENIDQGCLPMAIDWYKELIKAQEKR
ncbi:MAG TPA: M20/M25/M40 family metallo-hydrolase [Erysipelotrichaceae bacterium]|jgi:carboxypeptidase PM20D1|nr:M20/M25/M40 family metallo-hydrolase [Erysipelotrichia bacterium]HPX32451.1 M20/M25/M40 family metallo-hydrolase [Erysipelotrichaceae bacterium]HQA85148.1 M20/M25/M40 family metallo-hydrolase [Erysipelotrichaceae bacterium]